MSEIKEENPNSIIDAVLDKIEKNDFVISFFTPPMNSPSGGMGVLFKMARHLKDSGFNVKMIYEPQIDRVTSFEKSKAAGKQVDIYSRLRPDWLDFDISDIDIIPLGDQEIKFSNGEKVLAQPFIVNPEDFLIIPEGIPGIMKKTMQVSCKRIVLAQSWFYVLGGLEPGETWQHFGIRDVVSVSDAVTEYLNAVMPGLSIKQFSQGINREIFRVPEKRSSKFPIIGFTCRGGFNPERGDETSMKMVNIIKTFYAFFPHYKWIRFIFLGNSTRHDFAERLASCSLVLNADDIAGFGTIPLEAMACGTHVVGWANYGGKEYMNPNNGFWAQNGDIFQIAELLGLAMNKLINGELDLNEVYDAYEKTLSSYTSEGEAQSILNIINEYKNERINEISNLKK